MHSESDADRPDARDDAALPSAARAGFGITRFQWTVIAGSLALAALLVFGGLLPTRERTRMLREKNLRMADEILVIDREMRTLEQEVQDLEHDPQAWERELRQRGATAEGEVIVPPIPPIPGRS